MISVQQAEKGLMRYIDSEIMPKLTGWRKVGMGAYIALIARNGRSLIAKYKDHPAVAVLNVTDGESIDIDAVYNAILPYAGEAIKIDIPAIGEISLNREDIDKIYRYMKGDAEQ